MPTQNITEKNMFKGMIFENIAMNYIESVLNDLNKKEESEKKIIENTASINKNAKKALIKAIDNKIKANKISLKKYKSAMILSKALIAYHSNLDVKEFLDYMQLFYSDMTDLIFKKDMSFKDVKNENIIPAIAQKVEAFEAGCVKIGNEFYKITI